MSKNIQDWTNDIKKTNRIVAIVVIVSFILLSGMLFVTRAVSAEETGTGNTGIDWPEAVKIAIGFISAAMATGMGSFAAGKAVSMVGSAAMGAVAEKPEILGRSLIFVGLAEGVAIYGLIISIIILGKV
ncbi:MAG: ATP synthase subunit C [bacterium]|nr:ATP synthase subunit C [bacterium]